VLAATLAIFAVQNIETVPLKFLPYTFTGNVWWIAVGAAILGFLMALLLALPGRMAEIWHDRSTTYHVEQMNEELAAANRRKAGADAARRESQQQSQQLQTQLRQLIIEREDLIADRDRLRAERNTFRHQLAMTQQGMDTAPVTAATPATNTPSEASPVDADERDEDVATEPLAYPERDDVAPDDSDTEVFAAERPAPKGRRRGFRRRATPSEDATEAGEAQGQASFPPDDPVSQSA